MQLHILKTCDWEVMRQYVDNENRTETSLSTVALRIDKMIHELWELAEFDSALQFTHELVYRLNTDTAWEASFHPTRLHKDCYGVIVDDIDYGLRISTHLGRIEVFVDIERYFDLTEDSPYFEPKPTDDFYIKQIKQIQKVLKDTHIGVYSDEDYYDLAALTLVTLNDKELSPIDKVQLIFYQILPVRQDWELEWWIEGKDVVITDRADKVLLRINQT